MLVTTNSIHIVLKVLTYSLRQEKEIKIIELKRMKTKLYSQVIYKCIHRKSKETTDKQLEEIFKNKVILFKTICKNGCIYLQKHQINDILESTT